MRASRNIFGRTRLTAFSLLQVKQIPVELALAVAETLSQMLDQVAGQYGLLVEILADEVAGQTVEVWTEFVLSFPQMSTPQKARGTGYLVVGSWPKTQIPMSNFVLDIWYGIVPMSLRSIAASD